MKIPLINIHIMTEKTLTSKLKQSWEIGKREAIRATNSQMSEMLHDNVVLAHNNAQLRKKYAVKG